MEYLACGPVGTLRGRPTIAEHARMTNRDPPFSSHPSWHHSEPGQASPRIFMPRLVLRGGSSNLWGSPQVCRTVALCLPPRMKQNRSGSHHTWREVKRLTVATSPAACAFMLLRAASFIDALFVCSACTRSAARLAVWSSIPNSKPGRR